MRYEWKTKPLGDIISLIIDYRGKTPKKLGGDWSTCGIRALSAKNIKTREIVQHDTIRFVDFEMYKSWMKDEIQRGDILITSEAPFGEIYYWNCDEKIVLSQRLFAIRCKNEYYAPFIFQYMTSEAFQGELRGRATGTTVTGLRQPELLKCLISFPEYEDQVIIADTLSALDEKIANNKKINQHLEQIAQAIFKSWFVDFEPWGGVMPSDWREGTLGEIIELFDFMRIPISGNQRDKMAKVYPYYGAATLMDYVDNYLFDGIYLLLGEDGTVIDDLGFPILQYVWGKFWVNNHAHILQGQNGFSVESLYVLLKQTIVTSIVTGAVQLKINQANLKALGVVVPTDDKIQEFNALIDPLFAQIRKNSDENLRLAELRDTLLPRLMSGELSVADINNPNDTF